AEAFSTSITHAGSAVTLYALGVVIGAPIITALGAKLNRKMLLVVLAGIFTLGNVAVAAAPSLP
ncbi:MFS transporter, partial [Brevibacterium paucivorans]